MSYFINPVGEDRCVFLLYEGEMPSAELSAARREANGVLGQQHWNRMLINVTQMQSMPTPAELIDHARAIGTGIPGGGRVALVVRPEQVRSARLVEQVARHGRVFLAYFLNPDKAALWVKQSPRRQIMGRNGKEKS